MDESLDVVKFDEKGLVPAIIQDIDSGQVLMVAYMNRTALQRTIETGKTHFWSRSREKYWMKGESSGHTQDVQEIYIDCDADSVLVKVKQRGAACHEGYYSCFFRRLSAERDWTVVGERVFDPEQVYREK